MGEYIPRAPIDDEAKKYNQNLPGMGGVFNYINLHAYHYAGNNPVKLTDPTGAIINGITSFYKQNDGPWINDMLNDREGYSIYSYGCAITGLANIFTTNRGSHMSINSEWLSRFGVTPRDLNIAANFGEGSPSLAWAALAANYDITIDRYYDGNEAQQKILSANTSEKGVFILAQVTPTYKDPGTGELYSSEHWVGINGPLVDLNRDGENWIKISPTQTHDTSSKRQEYDPANWQKRGNDMYVRLSSVVGAARVEL
jgi:hypothetical protein